MPACSFLGVESSLYEGPQWWICALCVVMPATQRAAIVSWFQGASRTVVQSRRVLQLREWLRRVSAGAIAYLSHIYLSRLFFCLHPIITRLLAFFLSFFFIWSVSWLPEEVDVTRFFCNHKTGKCCSSLVGNSFSVAVLWWLAVVTRCEEYCDVYFCDRESGVCILEY